MNTFLIGNFRHLGIDYYCENASLEQVIPSVQYLL
jgi:hypothetical protein